MMTPNILTCHHSRSLSVAQGLNGKLVCVMVGLPARGKTFISQKLSRYLNWLGISTQVFNVGNYRRKLSGSSKKHDFFDPANREAEEERLRAAVEAMNEMIDWLRDSEGQVAVYDATNTSLKRRRLLRDTCEAVGLAVLFIESVCEREDLIVDNIMEVKLGCPDYIGIDPVEAVADFQARIRHYEQVYEPVGLDPSESSASYVKLINVGEKAFISSIMDYRQSKIVFYLMNLHIKPRSIYLCRHGETLFNQSGRIGGNADLSDNGKEFARRLPDLLKQQLGDVPLAVWTSTFKRTIQSVKHLSYPKTSWKALDEINAGVCEELTYEEIAEQYPADFSARDQDKFHYRYPAGESYADLVLRLEPVIMELERQDNILVVGHQAVLRAILAYFMNKTHDELPYLEIPLHLVLKLTPRAYKCDVEIFPLGIEAVNTHRSKPE